MPVQSTGVPIISSVNFYSTGETNKSTDLGALAQTSDGRTFRYVLAGGTTLVVGKLQQSSAEQTNFKDMVITTLTAGQFTATVTLGGTATTANLLVGGMFVVSAGTGIGQFSRVLAHDVQSSGTGSCNFTVEDAWVTTAASSPTATVYPSPYSNVIITPTTQTGISVGVAGSAITNAKYGWVQCGGLAACLADATPTTAAAMSLSPSVSTAGCVTKQVSLSTSIGYSLPVATVSAEVQPVFLTIAD